MKHHVNKGMSIAVAVAAILFSGCGGGGACVGSTLGPTAPQYCYDGYSAEDCSQQGQDFTHSPGHTCEDLGYTKTCPGEYAKRPPGYVC